MGSQKLGDVELNSLDKNDEYTRMIINRARSIAKYTKHNVEIFDILCQFLLKFRTKSYYDDNINEWVTQIENLNKTLKDEEILKFVQAVKNAYSISRNDTEISDLRGKLFEVVMYDIYSPIYCKGDSILGCGCEVIINNEHVNYVDDDPEYNKKTVDIAGYNRYNSELYEVKVGPSNFSYNIILYLNMLKEKAIQYEITNTLKVGCVTMDTKANLMRNLKKVKLQHKVSYDDLQIYGRDDVKVLFNKV